MKEIVKQIMECCGHKMGKYPCLQFERQKQRKTMQTQTFPIKILNLGKSDKLTERIKYENRKERESTIQYQNSQLYTKKWTSQINIYELLMKKNLYVIK